MWLISNRRIRFVSLFCSSWQFQYLSWRRRKEVVSSAPLENKGLKLTAWLTKEKHANNYANLFPVLLQEALIFYVADLQEKEVGGSFFSGQNLAKNVLPKSPSPTQSTYWPRLLLLGAYDKQDVEKGRTSQKPGAPGGPTAAGYGEGCLRVTSDQYHLQEKKKCYD